MKQLFYEHEAVGTYELAWLRRDGDIERETITAYLTCKAHWDQKLAVLVIDLECGISEEFDSDWLPVSQRVFETQRTQASALRSVIAHTDAFSHLIHKAMPVGDAHRSDDEVKRAFQMRDVVQ